MNRRKFLNIVGGCCCSIILPNCSTNEITQRKQLIIYPEAFINRQSEIFYKKFLQRSKISENKKDIIMMNDIAKRLIDNVNEYFIKIKKPNPTLDFKWEYNLVEDKQVNAFCAPGGKIAVYTGILDVTKNTNGLAAIMGHEIAHAVAKHSVERASRGTLLNISTQIIDIASGGKLSTVNRTTGMNTVGLLSQLGIMNPFSRKQESEADYLGMIFSSLSGYDIRETVKIWERMKEFNKGKEPAEFMSTHPSADNRIKKITEWTNEIILDYPPIKS